jgi:hypothetical protein
MEKLERHRLPEAGRRAVVPTGYSFNLDGTSIYMTMAALFVAQVSGVHLSFSQQLSLLGILLLTSKGAAAVTGSGFITLAATLSAFPNIPLAGLALLLGVDRFMSEARAITNLIGNAVATMVIARWEGGLDMPRVRRILAHGVPELHDESLDAVKSGVIAADGSTKSEVRTLVLRTSYFRTSGRGYFGRSPTRDTRSRNCALSRMASNFASVAIHGMQSA